MRPCGPLLHYMRAPLFLRKKRRTARAALHRFIINRAQNGRPPPPPWAAGETTTGHAGLCGAVAVFVLVSIGHPGVPCVRRLLFRSRLWRRRRWTWTIPMVEVAGFRGHVRRAPDQRRQVVWGRRSHADVPVRVVFGIGGAASSDVGPPPRVRWSCGGGPGRRAATSGWPARRRARLGGRVPVRAPAGRRRREWRGSWPS